MERKRKEQEVTCTSCDRERTRRHPTTDRQRSAPLNLLITHLVDDQIRTAICKQDRNVVYEVNNVSYRVGRTDNTLQTLSEEAGEETEEEEDKEQEENEDEDDEDEEEDET